MSNEDVRLLIAVALPCLTVLIGIVTNYARISDLNNRIGDLRTDMRSGFADLTRLMESRFQIQDEKLYRVEQVLDARLKHLEEK